MGGLRGFLSLPPVEVIAPSLTGDNRRGYQPQFAQAFVNRRLADADEPANFALPSKTLPEKCLHHSDHGRLRHSQAHNIYGMEMARASREGALAHQPDNRPFVISRAGYAGVQRYALVWTGDNSSVWEHLADSIQMLLNLGLSGVPFCGADVGGFLESSGALLGFRWPKVVRSALSCWICCVIASISFTLSALRRALLPFRRAAGSYS